MAGWRPLLALDWFPGMLFMSITIALFFLFVLALAVLGFVAVRVFTTRDAEGRAQPVGCAVGCLLGLVFALLGVAGLGGFLVSLSVNSVADGIESLPVRSVTLVSEDGPDDPEVQPFHDPWRPLHILIEIEGSRAHTEQLVAAFERLCDGEARIEITESEDSRGRPRTILDVALPADRHDLRELEREVRRFLPTLELEEGVRVRMRTSRDS